MTFILGSIYLFVSFICIAFAKQRQIKYETMSGSNADISCAVQGMSGVNIGVKSDDVTGQCILEQYPWLETYSSGFTYLKKRAYVELDKDDWFVIPEERFVLHAMALPGIFGGGARLEFHFKLPVDSSWDSFHLVLLDGEINTDDPTSYIPYRYFVHAAIEQGDNLFMEAYDEYGMIGYAYVVPSPFVDDVTHVIVFVATETHIEILINNDDSLKRVLPYAGPVETCRIFGVEVYSSQSMPLIEKVEFHEE